MECLGYRLPDELFEIDQEEGFFTLNQIVDMKQLLYNNKNG